MKMNLFREKNLVRILPVGILMASSVGGFLNCYANGIDDEAFYQELRTELGISLQWSGLSYEQKAEQALNRLGYGQNPNQVTVKSLAAKNRDREIVDFVVSSFRPDTLKLKRIEDKIARDYPFFFFNLDASADYC